VTTRGYMARMSKGEETQQRELSPTRE